VAEYFVVEPELMATARGSSGEVDGLAVEAERHLERRLGAIAGVIGVGAAVTLAAEVDCVVHDDDDGLARLDRHLGEHRRAHGARPGEPDVAGETALADAGSRGDLVDGRDRCDSERLGVDTVDVGRLQASVGEGTAHRLDRHRRRRARVVEGVVGLTHPHDRNRHVAPLGSPTRRSRILR
jgi:hypothetical protein